MESIYYKISPNHQINCCRDFLIPHASNHHRYMRTTRSTSNIVNCPTDDPCIVIWISESKWHRNIVQLPPIPPIGKKNQGQEKSKCFDKFIIIIKNFQTFRQMAEGLWKHRPEFLPCIIIYSVAFMVRFLFSIVSSCTSWKDWFKIKSSFIWFYKSNLEVSMIYLTMQWSSTRWVNWLNMIWSKQGGCERKWCDVFDTGQDAQTPEEQHKPFSRQVWQNRNNYLGHWYSAKFDNCI